MTARHSLNLVGLNVNGASTTTTLSALLREAKRKHVHVLLLQEHHLGRADAARATQVASACGYTSFWSSSDSAGHRGGTGVLVRADLAAVTPVVHNDQGDTMSGRVCAVDLVVSDVSARLVSVYVPIDQSRRVPFLQGLPLAPWVSNNMIIQGDWNCVENHRLDTRRPAGKTDRSSQENIMIAAAQAMGVEDTYRLLHGDASTGFTRYSSTVNKRLDRFYSMEYGSPWRWLSCDAADDFFRAHGGGSDHIAVAATLQINGREEIRPKARMINPQVMQFPHVRSRVRKAVALVDERYPEEEVGIATNWELTKKAVAEVLQRATTQSTYKDNPITELEQELRLLYHARRRVDPGHKIHATIASKEAELAELRKKQRPSPWLSYLYSLGEELSSKLFYRKFKAKHASLSNRRLG